ENAATDDDYQLAQRLVDLRIEAYSNLKWPEPSAEWPPAHDNRFDSVDGFPEVTLEELDVENLKAGILGKGGLIVRGLMQEPLIAEMRSNIDRVLQARVDFANEKPGAGDNPWYHRSPNVIGGPVQ